MVSANNPGRKICWNHKCLAADLKMDIISETKKVTTKNNFMNNTGTHITDLTMAPKGSIEPP